MGVDSGQLEHFSVERPAAALDAPAAPSGAPLLEPRPGGWAERFATRVAEGHPIRAFLAAVVTGYVALVAGMVVLGLLLTNMLLGIDGVERWDEHLNAWLAERRTPALVDASWVGSTLAGGLVIPVVVGVLLLVFVLTRRWRLAAFTLFVICVESGAYRATSLIVPRERPDVNRLEDLPVDASYPSGHTAASVALYGGLLIVLASRVRSAWARGALWTLVVLIPLFVGWSRMERGMHHLTDTLAAALMGAAAVVVTVAAARTAGAAARQRDEAGT